MIPAQTGTRPDRFDRSNGTGSHRFCKRWCGVVCCAAAAAAALCAFCPRQRERVSERAACVAPTEREIERGGVVARVCEHNMKMERGKIFKERIKNDLMMVVRKKLDNLNL